MGFSAMLTDEYIMIVSFAYHLQFGLKDHGISTQQKALAVIGNLNLLYGLAEKDK